MMKKKALCLCMLLLLALGRQAALGEMKKAVYYGGGAGDSVVAALPLEDGGMIVCGTTYSTDGDFAEGTEGDRNTYAFATRFDAQWNVVWQVIHSRFWMFNAFEAILPQPDGSHVLAFTSHDREENAFSLVHIDPDGRISREIDLDIRGYAPCFPDGEYLVVQSQGDSIDLPYDPNLPWDRIANIPILECFDAQGDLLWRQEYPELLEAEQMHVKATPEGYIVTALRRLSIGMQQTASRAMLARLDDGGRLLWHLELDSGDYSVLSDGEQYNEGGIVAVGGIAEAGELQGVIVWVDRDGSIVNERRYPLGESMPFMEILTNEQGYLLMGGAACSPLAWIVQTDRDGDLLWNERIMTQTAEPFQCQHLYRMRESYCFVAIAHVDEEYDFNNSDLIMIPFVHNAQ